MNKQIANSAVTQERPICRAIENRCDTYPKKTGGNEQEKAYRKPYPSIFLRISFVGPFQL